MQIDVFPDDKGYLTIKVPLDKAMRQLIDSATRVCDLRYSDSEWDELNAAFGAMIAALQALGVKFNNPRIK